MKTLLAVSLLLLVACGTNPLAIADFHMDISLATAPAMLVTGTGRYPGCKVTWTFRANDPSATVYYSTGPGMTATASQWWENGDFQGSIQVPLFVPNGRQITYNLHRVNGTAEIWRQDSGPMAISC